MGIFTQISNKFNYLVSSFLNDPEADAYAEQQTAQQKHDAEAKARLDKETERAQIDAENSAKAAEDAIDLNERSKFDSGRAFGKVTSGVLSVFYNLILIAVILYAGHLAANEAIGYSISFRILSFIYGALCFWYIIPRSLIKRYYYNEEIAYYTFLPLSTFKPIFTTGKVLLGPFCYTENEKSIAAKEAVELLYKNGYLKSFGQAAPAAVAAPVAAAAAAPAPAPVAAAAPPFQPPNHNLLQLPSTVPLVPRPPAP